MLITLNELGITVGFLLAFLVNYILMDAPGGWRVMFGLTSGNTFNSIIVQNIKAKLNGDYFKTRFL